MVPSLLISLIHNLNDGTKVYFSTSCEVVWGQLDFPDLAST